MEYEEIDTQVEVYQHGKLIVGFESEAPDEWRRDHIAYDTLKKYRKTYPECVVVIDGEFSFTNFKSCRDPEATVELERSA